MKSEFKHLSRLPYNFGGLLCVFEARMHKSRMLFFLLLFICVLVLCEYSKDIKVLYKNKI